MIRGSSVGQEEIKCHSYLEEGQGEDLGHYRVVNHNSIPDGVNNPGNYV